MVHLVQSHPITKSAQRNLLLAIEVSISNDIIIIENGDKMDKIALFVDGFSWS